MTTLQDLIDFAKEKNLDPSNCVLLFGEKCGDGSVQYDYLFKLRHVEGKSVVNHKDEIETVETGLAMEILPW